MSKKLLAENNNMIADSSEVRTQLLEQVNDGRLTLEQAQKQLKQIQKTAHEKGLYTRDDIISKRWIDFETAKAKAIYKNMKKLDKKLKNKDNIPAKKNKI
jgi:plasmid replication initiation protein